MPAPAPAKLTSRLPRSLRLLLALCAIIPLCAAARGVHFILGYLFSRPLPSAQFANWYAAHGARMSPQSA